MGQYLSSPCTLVEIEQSSGDKMEFGVGSLQGWRVSMEDSHIAVIGLKDNGKGISKFDKEETGLFAVFDGHGGKEVALFAEAKFEDCLISSKEFVEGKYEEALKRTFHKIDELLTDAQYDAYLKNMKKLPNPAAYTSVNHPSFPPEKAARKIQYHELNLARFGVNNHNQAGSNVSPTVVSPRGLTVTMEPTPSSAPHIAEIDEGPFRNRALTVNQQDGREDNVDYDKLSHEVESKLHLHEDVTILKEEIKEMVKKGEFDHNHEHSGAHDSKINSKNVSGSPTKSGSASSIAKLIIEHSKDHSTSAAAAVAATVDVSSAAEKGPETDSDTSSEESDNTAGSSVEEEGEDPNAIPTYQYTIPPRAPITVQTETSNSSSVAPKGPLPPPSGPPPVCRLSNHRVTAGCTAVVALRIQNKLYVANAGDSRAVLCRGDHTAYDLSIDHKPYDDIEKNRVEAAGGFVNAMGRINGNLNLSRSLGDLKYKQNHSLPPDQQIITAEPDVVTYTIEPSDQFMIIGCDGIWDCLTSQQACDIVRKKLNEGLTPAEIVPQVLQQILATDTILSRGIGTDNMTLLIVNFKK